MAANADGDHGASGAGGSRARRHQALLRPERGGPSRGTPRLRAPHRAHFPGLDLGDEIRAVHRLEIGDSILLFDDGGVSAFAVCHWGPRSEGGSGTCYLKFAAARPGPGVERRFASLLAACDAIARAESLNALMAGVNAARDKAWRAMQTAGFRTAIQGIAMHRDNHEGFSGPDAFVLDDWR